MRTLKIALLDDKMRETRVKWFGFVSGRLETTLVYSVERIHIPGTRKKRRPLKIWREGINKYMIKSGVKGFIIRSKGKLELKKLISNSW